MGKNHEPWQRKFLRLISDAVERTRPVKVQPKHRISGPVPRLSPSDWWTDEGQAKILPRCNLCGERPLPSEVPLVRGLCGPCRARLDEAPDAA